MTLNLPVVARQPHPDPNFAPHAAHFWPHTLAAYPGAAADGSPGVIGPVLAANAPYAPSPRIAPGAVADVHFVAGRGGAHHGGG